MTFGAELEASCQTAPTQRHLPETSGIDGKDEKGLVRNGKAQGGTQARHEVSL